MEEESQLPTQEPETANPEPEIVHPMDKAGGSSKNPTVIVMTLVVILAIGLGVISGFLFFQNKSHQTAAQAAANKASDKGTPPPPQLDTKTFKDSAVGMIEKNEANDSNAQGTHRLVREGGESQTAYLVSSVVNLDQYVGKKVTVWGETFSSTQVGWLMDVGRVEEAK